MNHLVGTGLTLRFRIDSQAVGDAVDVVEVGDHLGGVADGPVGKAQGPQTVKVIRSYARGSRGQLDRMVAQGPIGIRHNRLSIISGDLIGPAGVVDLSPEVIPVGDDSVVAVVDLGYDHRQHLELYT